MWEQGGGVGCMETVNMGRGKPKDYGGGMVGKRDRILRMIEKLAKSRANDAVRLAFLNPAELEELDSLDLSAVTEFRRSSNGTVELKFVDRVAALKWLLESVGEDVKAKELYGALEKGTGGEPPSAGVDGTLSQRG